MILLLHTQVEVELSPHPRQGQDYECAFGGDSTFSLPKISTPSANNSLSLEPKPCKMRWDTTGATVASKYWMQVCATCPKGSCMAAIVPKDPIQVAILWDAGVLQASSACVVFFCLHLWGIALRGAVKHSASDSLSYSI